MSLPAPGFGVSKPGAAGASPSLGRVALVIVAALFLVQLVARAMHRLVPAHALVRIASRLDRPIRERLLGPVAIARRVGLKPGMRVLHVGPADAAMTESLARQVGNQGRVEAIALGDDDVGRVHARLDADRVENASVSPGDGAALPYPDGSFDAICVVGGLGRVADPAGTLRELRRVLRPAGRLSTSEVISDLAYRLPSAEVRLGEAAGLELLEHFGNVIAYTINFRKPREND
jgi:SAM-dependent methyltransferase